MLIGNCSKTLVLSLFTVMRILAPSVLNLFHTVAHPMHGLELSHTALRRLIPNKTLL